METTIRQWGNSLGLRVPKPLARGLGWADGSKVELVQEGEHLLVRGPAGPLPPLADLVAEISEYNIHGVAIAEPAPPPPDRGDLVWLDGPDPGSRLPFLILSRLAYNARTGMALACPVDKRIKGYPFEVVLKVGGRTVGAVLADRVEAVAWRARRVERADVAPGTAVGEAVKLIEALMI